MNRLTYKVVLNYGAEQGCKTQYFADPKMARQAYMNCRRASRIYMLNSATGYYELAAEREGGK